MTTGRRLFLVEQRDGSFALFHCWHVAPRKTSRGRPMGYGYDLFSDSTQGRDAASVGGRHEFATYEDARAYLDANGFGLTDYSARFDEGRSRTSYSVSENREAER